MENSKYKLIVFCPIAASENLRMKIGDNGAGVIGEYSYCSFVTIGKGYFKPSLKANPYFGEQSKINETPEAKIEVQVSAKQLQNIIKIIKENHPYEEVPIEVYKLIDY